VEVIRPSVSAMTSLVSDEVMATSAISARVSGAAQFSRSWKPRGRDTAVQHRRIHRSSGRDRIMWPLLLPLVLEADIASGDRLSCR
jgi:hypothetical protein